MDDDLTTALKSIYSGRYWALMGIETIEVGEGNCASQIQLQEHHFNYNEVVHGGVISGLIDSAAGLAVRSVRSPDEVAERPHATSDLHVRYLAPATGTRLVARARVLKAGRTALFTHVDVFDDRERMVATGSVTFVVSQKWAAPPPE